MTNETPESVIAEALSSAGAPLMHSRVEEGVASALRAANMLLEPGGPDAANEELVRIKPLFENLSREYPNECNKRVKAEAERDAATAAIASVTAERDSAMARIAKAWELHEPFTWSFGYGPVQSCKWCADHGAPQEVASWPCPTIQALGDVSNDQNLINPHNHAEVW